MRLPLNLSMAVSSLSAHKVRAVLAMLGVFLGALAFTGVQHVSAIMVRKAVMETEKLGPNLYAVVAGQIRFRRSGGVRVRGNRANFRVADARAVMDGVPSVLSGTPFASTDDLLKAEGNALTARVYGTWPTWPEVRSVSLAQGRYFTERELEERAMVCVLGPTVAERLFGSPEKAMGKIMRIYRAPFRIIGIMEPKGRDLAGDNQDEFVFMPLTTFMRRASNVDYINGVFLRLAKDADIAVVEDAARRVMRRQHKLGKGQADDFSLLAARDTIRLQQQALDLMSTLGVITSVVSFGVGGMGILSIMILVVRARRVEIGVRRAVGGKRSDIVRQFLFEAGLMAGAGGACGALATLVLVLGLHQFASLPLIILPESLLLTMAGSCVLGLAAGAYPAWQAAHIEILDVLKSQG
ncbi:ABC transporter permease [Pseudodesulfovibrio senegalensis]|jgi:putative ABC transport system permease protein|uniref:FtsX-like permease family protein n=1 Tax=Pseudodesulfovibrio senegalensis TaxID=1721087 RepID=A0A6N6N2T8_9BACT|nr:ABC transporter permease [Pseudodesulfovibrio senegalensis]KAB1440862.1 FtsX-like permease family protein [Pseudodesulfovibrio senegalensis]